MTITAALLSTGSSSFQHAGRAFSRNSRAIATSTRILSAKPGQAEVVLVGCGAPNRGMGWYHAVQMLEGRLVVPYYELLLLFQFIYLDGSSSWMDGLPYLLEEIRGVTYI